MYRIVSATDHSGNPKTEWFDELSRDHPGLMGYPIQFMPCFCFAWRGDPFKMLRTSYPKAFDVKGDLLIVTTQNSVYTLEYTGNGELITEESLKKYIIGDLMAI